MSTIKAEAERCLKCKKPQCSKGCPVATPIPEVVNLFLESRLPEAGALLFANNPMTAVCSMVCPHEKNCYGHCILNKKGTPIQFFRIEQYVSQFYLDTFIPEAAPRNGKKVAVVGAGPAGITAAVLLSQKGYRVTLFDAMDKIGGALRYGIPDFRLPRAKLDQYKDILDALGVQFRPNTRVGTHITAQDMMIDGYDAVFLGTGTERPNRLGLLGETLGHVHFAVDYLKSPDSYRLGKRLVIVGAGNVAVDAARTAIRKAGCEATILNFMGPDELAANEEEVEMALIDGVEFLHHVQALRITEDVVKCVGVEKVILEDGTVRFDEDYTRMTEVPADTVIIAIGQGPGADVVSDGSVQVTGRGLLEVDEDGRTSRDGVFAAGDVVTGPRTVVEAVAMAKKTVAAIDAYCGVTAAEPHEA